jgi:hypothetical protein
MVPDMHKIKDLLEPKLQKGHLKVIGTSDGTHSEWYWKREFPESIIWLMELKRE